MNQCPLKLWVIPRHRDSEESGCRVVKYACMQSCSSLRPITSAEWNPTQIFEVTFIILYSIWHSWYILNRIMIDILSTYFSNSTSPSPTINSMNSSIKSWWVFKWMKNWLTKVIISPSCWPPSSWPLFYVWTRRTMRWIRLGYFNAKSRNREVFLFWLEIYWRIGCCRNNCCRIWPCCRLHAIRRMNRWKNELITSLRQISQTPDSTLTPMCRKPASGEWNEANLINVQWNGSSLAFIATSHIFWRMMPPNYNIFE